MKKGKLAIEFAIQKNGWIADMRLVATAADGSLDRAAWGGIAASNPFPPLPSEFTGPYLALRVRFYYNPDKADLEGIPAGKADLKEIPNGTPPSVPKPVKHAILIQSVADAHRPKYPKKASKAKLGGIVRLEAEVGDEGRVKGMRVLEGNAILVDSSVKAISKWQFNAAQRDGTPVADEVPIEVEFSVDGEQVRAQVVWPQSSSSAFPIKPR